MALPSGQLVLFTLGEDRQLWHKWQLCDGCAWSNWVSLGGGLASSPRVVRKSNGVLVAFAIALDRDVWHKWQLCNGCAWSGWSGLQGGPFACCVSAGVYLGTSDPNDDRLWVQAVTGEQPPHARNAVQPCAGCGWGGIFPKGWVVVW